MELLEIIQWFALLLLSIMHWVHVSKDGHGPDADISIGRKDAADD